MRLQRIKRIQLSQDDVSRKTRLTFYVNGYRRRTDTYGHLMV